MREPDDQPGAPTLLPDQKITAELLRRVADGLLSLPYVAWRFGDSVAFEAMVVASSLLGDEQWLSFGRGFARAWATHRTPFARTDCTAPGLAIVQMYVATGDALLIEVALELAGYLSKRPTIGGVFATFDHAPLQHSFGPDNLPAEEIALLIDPPAGAFVDCLHFDPPFFAALGRAVGDDRWSELGVEQALGYVSLLQDDNGLFEHFVLESVPRRFGPGWGRGQGWALLGLLDVIEQTSPEDGRRRTLIDATRRLIAAMILSQRVDGNWDAVVDNPASGLETSTAAFMACAFLRAERLGIASSDATAAGRRALAAALRATSGAGVLRGVSAAVNACTSAVHYAYVPRDFLVPWGQGPLALALAEHLRSLS